MNSAIVVVVLTLGLAAAGCGHTSQDTPDFVTFGAKVSAHVRAIYRHGLAVGNRPDVFAKVGDSNTATGAFLGDIGCGKGQLGTHQDLKATVRFFSRRQLPRGYTPLFGRPVACHSNNSFVRRGFSTRNGWGVTNLLAPFVPATVVVRYLAGHRLSGHHVIALEQSPAGRCSGVYRQSLACELHVLKPSIALIMIGTNDVPTTPLVEFLPRLRRVVTGTMAAGTIPVLSTIPPRRGFDVAPFNTAIIGLAKDYEIPLWNFWRTLDGSTVNRGLTAWGVHLSSYRNDPSDLTAQAIRYGMNARNLQALEVLDVLRRRVLSVSPNPG